MIKAAIYARVSTDEQNTSNQIPLLKAWAEQLRLFDTEQMEIIDVYREAESAWKGGHQKELSRMIADGTRGKFKVVIVWSLDRLSREGPLATLSIVKKLDSYGLMVYSHEETWINTTDPNLRELFIAVAGYINRESSKKTSNRTKAGLARILREGKTNDGKPILKLGRPKGSKDKKQRSRRGNR